MENLNAKTGLAPNGKTFTGAVLALTVAVAVSMAPTSQAFAQQYQYTKATASNVQGTTAKNSKTNAMNLAKTRCPKNYQYNKKVSEKTTQKTARIFMTTTTVECRSIRPIKPIVNDPTEPGANRGHEPSL